MSSRATGEKAPVGRPRRFGPADERRMLIDAGLVVMAGNAWSSATVQDVLAVAGVSTRAFYRHFVSKDELLLAIYRQEATANIADLQRVVDAVPDPAAAVEVWLDAFLEIFRSREKAVRITTMLSPAARGAVGYGEEESRSRDEFVRSLARTLRRAHAAGAIRSEQPVRDAAAIYGLALGTVSTPGKPMTRKQHEVARETVRRFVRPALGIAPAAVRVRE